MRDAFICDGIRTQLAATEAHCPLYALMTSPFYL